LNAQYSNSQSRGTKRRQVFLAGRIAGLLPVALVALPAGAQERDTVVTRVVSTWQTDVDRLKVDLLAKQRLETQLFRALTEIELRRRVALPDSQPKLMAQSQLLFTQMQTLSNEQATIKRRLETLCESMRKPEGWLGFYAIGFQRQDKRADGTKIVRYFEPPVVATVDPGSPAERVGVRAGDVLMEIGGQGVMRGSIVISDLLVPGKEVVLKVQRGSEIITLTPTVLPLPEAASTTSCAFVDPAVAYIVSPTPAQAPRMVRVQTGSGSGGKYTYTYETAPVRGVATARVRPDSAAGLAPAMASSNVVAGPMMGLFGVGANSLAGLQLMALSRESSRMVGVSHGILVNQVMVGTPGYEAGLRGGDILLSADSIDLRTVMQLQQVIRRASDRLVTLLIVRDKKKETVQLRW
jgi:C-terminal processing protease CtpA/Prc